MKRIIAFLVCIVYFIQLAGCTRKSQFNEPQRVEKLKLNVVTSYGGDDGNRRQYESAIENFQSLYDIQVVDNSDTSNEEWKEKVLSDFITGSEPDVLFYFLNADAEPLIEADKVVSLEEIQQEYPSFASNIKRSMIPAAADGKHYAVPSMGFWETLFVNKSVLEECGVSVPGKDYTWNQFLADCETIKEKGYTPIACSLADVPHYWFEFTVMNNGSVRDHYQLPVLNAEGRLVDDRVSRKWIRGLNDIKLLYQNGYFPENTLYATDSETVSMFAEARAAFLLDGSWKVGYLMENYPDQVSDFGVSYFPGKGSRAPTDTIGGISMGYFITRKAWSNPLKRNAVIQFVSYMTSDDTLGKFVTTEVTALKNRVRREGLNELQQAAADSMKELTGVTGAVQDLISTESKKDLFSNIPKIVIDQMSAADAVKSALKLNG